MKTIDRKTLFRVFLMTLVVVVLDQTSKLAAVSHIARGERIEIVPGLFDLTLTYNKGAAFGMFSGIADGTLRHILLSVTTLIALGAVFYFFVKELASNLTGQVAFALILGGAIGNVIDRVRLGEVIDFFLAYYQQYHWPVFNMADSCISIGVVILLLFHRSPKAAVA